MGCGCILYTIKCRLLEFFIPWQSIFCTQNFLIFLSILKFFLLNINSDWIENKVKCFNTKFNDFEIMNVRRGNSESLLEQISCKVLFSYAF